MKKFIRIFLVSFWSFIAVACQSNNLHFDPVSSSSNNYAHTKDAIPQFEWKAKFKSLTRALTKQARFNGNHGRSDISGVESVLIIKDGNTIFEGYFLGATKRQAHTLKSAGKSILSAVVGIALDKGLIRDINSPIYQYLPYVNYQNWDARKAQLSLNHLLSMTAGWDCDHISNYQAHCGAKMHEHSDPYKWLLDRPMKYHPGEEFNYNDAIPNLVTLLIAIQTKQKIRDFSNTHLFSPLGIKSDFFNNEGLTSREMGKFGQLFLQKGIWQGKQVISQRWVEDSTLARYYFKNRTFADSYAYFWWNKIFRINDKEYHSYFAAGNGGQYIVVFPELESVIVFTGKNYNRVGKRNQPFEIIERYILPVISG